MSILYGPRPDFIKSASSFADMAFHKESDLYLPEVGQGIFVSRERDIRHLINIGALVYTWLDLETTDKEWQSLEITAASLTTTDVAYNPLADTLYEVCVPDRNVLSPEAMAITRYLPRDIRNPERLSPQIAAARIFEDVQAAPYRLWNLSGHGWRQALGNELWQEYIDEKIIDVTTKQGNKSFLTVRHFPVLDDENKIVKTVRMHEPSPTRSMMQMSYRVLEGDNYDYRDESGFWKTHNMDKFNLGFRNTYFDNRAMAGRLFSANFPNKEIYAMNKKGLGNHAADVFTTALVNYFASTQGRQTLALGTRVDPETGWEKITAKLSSIMDENTRFEDPDIDLPEGVRIWDGTLHNDKRGHSEPTYDNAKSIAVHSYQRRVDPELLAHIEKLSDISYFRNFMTLETEDGVEFPTSHPIRFIFATGDDDKIYRPVPIMVLGPDDQRGKFNKIWGVRLDIDFETYRFEGKKVTELSSKEIADIIRTQRGQIGAIFHEVHLKRHRGVIDMEKGLKAGFCPDLTADELRRQRDFLESYIDDRDEYFVDKSMDGWQRQYSFNSPADDVFPYPEEEIWTAMGDVKYVYVVGENGEEIKIPRVIRDMAQDEFKRVNQRLGDSARALLRPQPMEWDLTEENIIAYIKHRKKISNKIENYQNGGKELISLSEALYDEESILKDYEKREHIDFFEEDEDGVSIASQVLFTLIEDKVTLMRQVQDVTRSYEVQILRGTSEKFYASKWQKIPFEDVAKLTDAELLSLKDEGRLRVRFEENPNHPTYVFGIRYLIENGWEDILSVEERAYYETETAFYIHGPPHIGDPDAHRIMSLPKQKLSIDRIRRNLIPTFSPDGEQKPALRDGEAGAADIFLAEDSTNAIIAAVERDGRKIGKKHPMTKSKARIMGFDERTGDPLINVEYPISKNHVVVKIPEGLADNFFFNKEFGHCCQILPEIEGLSQATCIVLEEEKTGRQFYAANSVLFTTPDKRHGAYSEFYRLAEKGYASNGGVIPDAIIGISCSELVPISETKVMPYPMVRVPQAKLVATKAPNFSGVGRGEPVTGFFIRRYDAKFRKGQFLRLRGVDDNGDETNWEALSKISFKPKEYKLSELLEMIDNDSRSAEAEHLAWVCGYDNTVHMKHVLEREFTEYDERIKSEDNTLYFFEVTEPEKITYCSNEQPRSAFTKELKKPEKTKQQVEKSPRFTSKRPPSADIRIAIP